MAKTFRKSILSIGKHRSPDGEVDVTTERLQHWANNFAKMKAAGHVIPMHYDHGSTREDLTPIALSDFKAKKSRSAKNTIGTLESVKLADDGKSAEVEFAVMDPKAVEQFDDNTIFVSPVIMPDWKDGAGNEFADAITHLDAVNHPVDHQQSEAEPVGLALRMGLSTEFYRLGVDTNDNKDPSDDAATMATVGDIVDLLGQIGIPLPEDTSGENLCDRLATALPVFIQNMNGGPMSDDPQRSQDTKVVDPGMATMSLEARTAIKEANDRAARAEAIANRSHQKDVMQRLSLLASEGKCTPDEVAKWKPAVEAVRLSLDDDGQPELSRVEMFIEDREGLEPGTVVKLDPKRLSVFDRPLGVTFGDDGTVTDAEADDVVKQLQEAGLVN